MQPDAKLDTVPILWIIVAKALPLRVPIGLQAPRTVITRDPRYEAGVHLSPFLVDRVSHLCETSSPVEVLRTPTSSSAHVPIVDIAWD